jgi:hypothetical protein
VAAVALTDDLERIATAATAVAADGERVAAVMPVDTAPGARAYVCAFASDHGDRSWVVLDDSARALTHRETVRAAVTLAALCEVAVESASLGDLDDLRSRLVALRLTEAPPGIDEAETAVVDLQDAVGAPPRLASTARLDEIGAALRRLELALDPTAPSRFALAMQSAQGAVDEIVREVEAGYRGQLR